MATRSRMLGANQMSLRVVRTVRRSVEQPERLDLLRTKIATDVLGLPILLLLFAAFLVTTG